MAYTSGRGMGRTARAVLIVIGSAAVSALASLSAPPELLDRGAGFLPQALAMGRDGYALAAAALGALLGLIPALLLTRSNDSDLLEWAGEDATDDTVGAETLEAAANAPMADAGLRRPLSVYDVIGLTPDPEWQAGEEPPVQAEAHDEDAPSFAGSPPLPGGNTAIGIHSPKTGLGGRFDKAEALASADTLAPQSRPVTPSRVMEDGSDLATLSFLQLTERLAQAMAANPLSPRRTAESRESPPPQDRLRHFEAATVQARRKSGLLSDDIRDVLADLDQIRGVA